MRALKHRDLSATGLDQHERLALLERATFGDVGLEQQVEVLRQRVQELESDRRRRELGFIGRLFGIGRS